MRLLLLTFCYCISLNITAQAGKETLLLNKDDNTLLWEVSGNGLTKNSYLFGTFHLMCKGDILISDQLKKAMSNASTVYMELDMDDPAMMMGGMMMMNMKGGKKLQQLYTDEAYKKVSSYFKDSLHMPIAFLERTKPYFLIAMLYPKMMPCKTVSGVEEELVKLAKRENKIINGLETMQFQASVFDSIPYEKQASELLKSIDSLPAYSKYFDTMVQVYKEQRLSQMENLFTQSEFGMEEHQDILLDKRNKNWVGLLKNIMKQQPVFVAVGAGHLVGKNGLIALLKSEGYTVRPLLNK